MPSSPVSSGRQRVGLGPLGAWSVRVGAGPDGAHLAGLRVSGAYSPPPPAFLITKNAAALSQLLVCNHLLLFCPDRTVLHGCVAGIYQDEK